MNEFWVKISKYWKYIYKMIEEGFNKVGSQVGEFGSSNRNTEKTM